MAGRKGKGTGLSRFEAIAGGALLCLYLLVLPFVRAGLFRGAESLFGVSLDPQAENRIYYYALFGLTLVAFYSFIGRSAGYFLGNFAETIGTAVMGLVFFYGVNELLFRLGRALLGHQVNLNDYAVSAQGQDAPRASAAILILIAPFVEEVLFRGYVFGGLKGRGTAAAYGASCLLFAFWRVWQFLGGGSLSLSGAVMLVQYLAPAAVLAWAYDRAGSFFAPLLVHMGVNALHVWWGG